MARPTAYKPEYAKIAGKMCELGATDMDVIDAFGIARSTFYKWRNEHQEFSDALKVGKDVPDDRVEMSLYRRAVGYEYEAVKIFQFQGQEVVVPYTEIQHPDTTAAIFWLKNRRPDLWRNQQPVDFELPENSTPVEKLESVFNAVAQGKFAPQDAASLIQSVKAMMEVEEITVLKAKLEQLEAQLSGTSAR